MRLLILDEKKLAKYDLPTEIEETFLIHYKSDNSDIENVITVEAINNEWQLKSNGSVDIIENNNIKDLAAISEYQYCNLKINSVGKIVILYCVPSIENKNYELSTSNLSSITIGKSNNCNICYSNSLTKDVHAKLVSDNNNWYVVTNKEYLVYLNGRKILKSLLKLGDVIFINGLKIIWMNNYIIINNPNNVILIKGLKNYQKLLHDDETIKEVSDEEMVKTLYSDDEYFYHTPRLKSVVMEENIQIDAPPAKIQDDTTPMILAIGTSITMAASSLMTGYSAFYGLSTGTKTLVQSIPQIVICSSMLIGCIVIPRFANHYKKKQKRKKEALRQKKYQEYLNQKEEQIERVIKQQKQILLENNLKASECIDLVLKSNENIWFREIKDDDFLNIRLGLGTCPVKIKLQAPEKHFTLEEDNLYDSVMEVINKTRTLDSIPISLSLTNKNVSAIICNCSFERDYINSIIVQLVTLQSSVDLKIVIFTDEENSYNWEYFKYMPHCLNDDKSVRFFATNLEEAKEISSYLEAEFKCRSEGLKNAGNEEYKDIKKDKGYKNFNQYYLIINDNFKLFKNIGIINLISKEEINCGFSLLLFEKSMKNLPTSCETFVNILDTESGVFEKELNNQRQQIFKAEYEKNLNMMELSFKLSNIPINIVDEKYVLPKSLPFLEMYGVSKIEQLNIYSRWKQNNPVYNLSVPIGVHTNGEVFKLDLHEKYHGPHGLIAGSTGSGKSELIITYILSMAINYHPDEVQFVLIDYKGGGLAGAFENKELGTKLPHLVGTITNLDTASMNRTLVSINSELKRRQKLFNEVRDKLGESTIDIYKYQKFYRDGLIDTPLSHLLIISDEFAELKTQQPEFMNQLISTARIGRALGVHLILATQKPMGIVNDQIWSNTKFRICLKVQDRGDSVGVLKRPEAASIKDVGRFYLQVGYDDYFDLGQSAWSGARYNPSDKLIKKIDNSINFINNYGLIIKSADDESPIENNANLGDQLTNIVKYLKDLAVKENIIEKNLWLDNIPEFISLSDLKDKYNYHAESYKFNPIVGEYDNPKEQEQGLLTIDLTAKNTLIYGMTGSGKENLLMTLIFSTILEHTPREVNFYILDFGSEVLKVFNNIPHVGDVALLEDSNKIIELINMLVKEIENRKSKLSDYAGNYLNYIKTSNEKMPLIIVVINNYELFLENYSKQSEMLHNIMRDGSKYGIVFIVTTSQSNSVRSRVTQYFVNKMSLQQSNVSDYRLLLNAPKNLLPTNYFGRGLVEIDKDVYEFQTAYICDKDNINSTIQRFKDESNKKYNIKAKKIPVVPLIISFNSLKKYLSTLNNVPLGISIKSKDIYYYDFTKNKINLVLANNLSDKIRFIKCLIKMFNFVKNTNITIIDFVNIFKNEPESNNYYYNDFNKCLKKISGEIKVEKNIAKKNIYIFIGIGIYRKKLDSKNVNILNDIFNNSNNYSNSYFIFIDTYANYKNLQVENWIKQVNSSNGIWLGEGITQQIAIRVNNVTSEDKQMNFPFMGMVVCDEQKEIIKCAIDDGEKNE